MSEFVHNDKNRSRLVKNMGHHATTLNRQNGSIIPTISVTKPVVAQIEQPTDLQDAQYQIVILDDLAKMAQLEPQWRALEEKTAKPSNVFQSFDWCYTWAKTFTVDNDCYDIHIVTISKGDECLLIWPMMTTCSGPFCILRWLSDPYSQYGDALVVESNDTSHLLQLAWQKLLQHPTADSIRLRHVRADAHVHDFLNQNAKSDGCHDCAPFLEIEKFPDEQAYDKRYTKSQRRRRKRIRKTLERIGPITFEPQVTGPALERSMKSAIAEKRQWLSERGLYSKPVMSDELQPFFATLAETGKNLTTRVSRLRAGERDIAYEIGLRYRGHHFGYITAHDAALTDASPGRLHMDLSQRAAINDGLKAFDLMVPANPHKKTWSSAGVATQEHFIHLNTRGAFYTAVYLKAIRPAIRWTYLTAPASLRRMVTRFVG